MYWDSTEEIKLSLFSNASIIRNIKDDKSCNGFHYAYFDSILQNEFEIWGFASERQNIYSSKEIVENNMTLAWSYNLLRSYNNNGSQFS